MKKIVVGKEKKQIGLNVGSGGESCARLTRSWERRGERKKQLPAQTVAFYLCYQMSNAQTRADRALALIIESPDLSTWNWIYLDLGRSES